MDVNTPQIEILQDSKPNRYGWSFTLDGSLFSEGGYLSEEEARDAAKEALETLREDEPDAETIVGRLLGE